LHCLLCYHTYLHFFFYSAVCPRDLHSFPTRRSSDLGRRGGDDPVPGAAAEGPGADRRADVLRHDRVDRRDLDGRAGVERLRGGRSEEHTSELQSPYDLVCRLLLEKKKKTQQCMQLHV